MPEASHRRDKALVAVKPGWYDLVHEHRAVMLDEKKYTPRHPGAVDSLNGLHGRAPAPSLCRLRRKKKPPGT